MTIKPAFIYKGRPYSFSKINKHFKANSEKLMPILGQTAVNFFKDRFRAQAWTDKRAERWKSRKNREKGNRRAILTKSGRLKNSIRLARASRSEALIRIPVKYAIAHNEGFKGNVKVRQHQRVIRGRVTVQSISTRRKSTRRVAMGSTTVKAHTRKMNMPQRQFVGNSHTLNRKLDRIVIYNIDKSFK